MNRIALINYLVDERSAIRYLEISAHNKQNTFDYIHCSYKISSFPNSSDDLFKQNQDKFDIIFIDGIHTAEQTLRDIENACQCLSKNGVIIIHDCMPPDAWHQREPGEFNEGENWNGTVWKAVLSVFNNTTYKCTLLDSDWGCGIIDTAHTQIPVSRQFPEKMDYEIHYPWLLDYKKSVSGYFRDQVKVFYHLACMGNWEEVFEEQLIQLASSGFKEINLSILGTEENLHKANLIYEKLNIKTFIIFHSPDLRYFEAPALLGIEEYARRVNGYVLYLHSKGVSNPEDKTKTKWRRLMMRELLENWESCVLKLPHYDAIGVNWRDMRPTSHFCGNFWYASTRYLRKLADFNIYYDNPLYKMWDRINDKRLGCEFWIGSGREEPRVLSLVCRNVDFCNHNFWKDK